MIVRDVVAHPPDPVHELLDPVEHRVELLGELVEVVAGASGGDPAREVSAHDLPACTVDRVDPAHRAPAHRERSGNRENEGQADAPREGEPDAPARPIDLVHVAAHEQQEPAGQGRCPRPGKVRSVVRLARRPEWKLEPALRVGRGVRPAAHVARERAAPGRREEVDERTAGTAGDPIFEHPGERGEPAPAIPVRKAPELAFDGRVRFHLQVHRRGPVDETEHHADRPLEHQQVHHGEAEGGASKIPRERLQSPGSRNR